MFLIISHADNDHSMSESLARNCVHRHPNYKLGPYLFACIFNALPLCALFQIYYHQAELLKIEYYNYKEERERACDCMGLKINAGKSKVLVVKKNQMGSCEIVRESGEEMQEVSKFNYLEVMVNTDGGMEDEVTHRELEERKIWITMEREHDIQRSKTGVI